MKKIFAVMICAAVILPKEILAPAAWAQDAAKPSSETKASLEGIEVAPDQVKLHLDAPARYNAFVTANPPRLVLELINTHVSLATKSLTGKGKILKRVRSGQFSSDPNPVARVVMDLNESSEYQVSLNGNDITVSLSATAATGPTGPEAAPEAEKKEEKPEEVSASMSDKNTPELAAMATQGSVVAPSIKDDAAAAAKRPVAIAPAHRGSKRDILASLPHDLISLDMDNMDIGDVLKLMATKASLNIIYGADVSGPLSLHVTDVPFNEAFSIILSMKGLVANQVGNNILRVQTPGMLTAERTAAVGVTRIFTLNYRKASEVKGELDQIRTAEKRVGVAVADDVNNQLIVTETPDGLASTERLLAQIDIRPLQVLIETKLVEVNLNNDTAFGIQWDYFQFDTGKALGKEGATTIGSGITPTGAGAVPFDQNAVTTPGRSAGALPVGAAGRGTGVFLPSDKVFGAFTLGRITNNYILSATLTAAASSGKAKVLSDPKIATLNGKQATINITTQIPYVTSNVSATGAQTQSVAYTTTGIQMAVTPTITADRRISLVVTPTVSKPSAVAASAGATGALAVDNRTATTNVLVKDGETIVIGGIITDSESDVIAKVPILGDIPILGWLFKKKTKSRSRVELLIFVTTKILPD
ncbi:MAG: type IV pilus secretin PilQ [Elusimicrobia bacterium]|nr:type IV pilus secretin PilQ [Elusimicrobiota bacterium]